jgi:hypothetical protein
MMKSLFASFIVGSSAYVQAQTCDPRAFTAPDYIHYSFSRELLLSSLSPNFEGFENNIAIYQWLVSHFEF